LTRRYKDVLAVIVSGEVWLKPGIVGRGTQQNDKLSDFDVIVNGKTKTGRDYAGQKQ
jgi:hypothetical protein